MSAVESGSAPMQVVMIGIADEIVAVDAGMVREIIDPIPKTRVAGAKPFVPSVVNVRGNVIPLADLRIASAWRASLRRATRASSSSN